MGVSVLKRPFVQVNEKKDDGQRGLQTAVATYDFDELGGVVGDIGLGVSIPANAVIWDGFYDVITTFTTAGADAGTIGLEAGTADLVAAVAVSGVGDVWDAGVQDIIADGTAANAVKVGTSAVELIVDVGGQAVTAGKAIFVVRYIITGA
jgi:hypothetical protein